MAKNGKTVGRRKRFVEEYLRNDHNGAKALRACGYTGRDPYSTASRMLADPEVQAMVAVRTQELLDESGVSTLRVLKELASIAYSDIRKAFREDGTLKPPAEWDDATAAAMEAIDLEETLGRTGVRVTKIRRSDKLTALTRLGQYLKLFRQVNEHTGENGGPIVMQVTSVEDEL